MPTYDYKCSVCQKTDSRVQTMRQYSEDPVIPVCLGHGPMERMLSVVPAMSGLANALAGDRHYDGMRAPDGTDISSRTKHREYMHRHGLTTADDFSGQWRKAEKERELLRKGAEIDSTLRKEITEQVMTAVAKSD
jgi:putative FmdB family regulatory protein